VIDALSSVLSPRFGAPASEERPGRFTIHDLVAEFGITARTLRFYEEKGLLTPERRGLERLYSRRDRARLKLVLMGKSVGFSLEEVRDMLDLYDLGDGQATQLTVALTRFEDKLLELEARRRDIDRAHAELSHARDIVRARLAALAEPEPPRHARPR